MEMSAFEPVNLADRLGAGWTVRDDRQGSVGGHVWSPVAAPRQGSHCPRPAPLVIRGTPLMSVGGQLSYASAQRVKLQSHIN